MNKASLTARWQTESGRQLARQVLARLVSGRELEGLGLGEHEGLADLRYLPAPTPEVLQRLTIEGWNAHQLGYLIRFDEFA